MNPPTMSPPETRRLGRRTLVFDRLESTNTYAAQLANDPGNDGTVVIAREQTGGRGQHGRTWQCPPGAGVLLSVLVFPPPALRRVALLTAWAAVSVCETIRQVCGRQAVIKWPNDVSLAGRKVCGILIEQGRGTVAGIGLNVNQSAEFLARAGLPLAGSLASVVGNPFDVPEVARLLIGQLDQEYDRLCRGDLSTLEGCWKGLIGLLGKQVAVECLDGIRMGVLRDLTFEGLEFQTADGGIVRVPPEMVRHLEPASFGG
jgi:BirA family biotin operon repressor/biotin-[acetyl-CoA-carboxylase] ligase